MCGLIPAIEAHDRKVNMIMGRGVEMVVNQEIPSGRKCSAKWSLRLYLLSSIYSSPPGTLAAVDEVRSTCEPLPHLKGLLGSLDGLE